MSSAYDDDDTSLQPQNSSSSSASQQQQQKVDSPPHNSQIPIQVANADVKEYNSGYNKSNPDLIQMDQGVDSPAAAAGSGIDLPSNDEAVEMSEAEQNVAAPLVGDTTVIVVNLLILIGFLIFTLAHVRVREQYLSLTCFAVPIVLLIKTIYEHNRKSSMENFPGVTTTSPARKKPLPLAGMIHRFVLAFVALLPFVVFLCMLITGVLRIVFSFVLSNLSASARWDMTLLIFIFSLVLAEENVKLLLYIVRDKRSEMTSDPKNFVRYGISTAVGLASAEVYLAVMQVTYLLGSDPSEVGSHHHHTGSDYNYNGTQNQNGYAYTTSVPTTAAPTQGEVPIREVLMIVFTFTAFLVPMHILSSYYLGLAAARVQVLGKTSRELVFPFFISVLFRTMFLAALLVVAIPVNFFVGMALTIASYALFVLIVMRYQSYMPTNYLKQTGYISILGFTPLGDDENAVDAGADTAAAAPANDENGENANQNNRGNVATTSFYQEDEFDEENIPNEVLSPKQ